MGGKVITEFVGLKSKMYSLITTDTEEKSRANGVKLNCDMINIKKPCSTG